MHVSKMRTSSLVMRGACSAALALSMIPAVAVGEAHAAFGNEQFVENGVKYDIYSTTSTVNGKRLNIVHVVGLEYDGNDAVAVVDGILDIPALVEHNGVTYDVGSIDSGSLANCKELVDLRIGDLGAGCIYSAALSGCENLKTIHVMGRAWVNGGGWNTSYASFSGNVDVLNIVMHDTSMDKGSFSASFSNSRTYCAVDFEIGATTTTAYINSYNVDKSSNMTQTVTPSKFSTLDEDEQFTDLDSAKPLCTETAPALPEGYDAWSFTHKWYSESEESIHDNDAYITGGGTARACKATDLSAAVAHVPSASLRVTGFACDPKPYAVNALGNKVDSDKIVASYYKWTGTSSPSSVSQILSEGTAIPVSEIVEAGTYAVSLSGAEGSGLTGSCATSFTLAVGTVEMVRVTSSDRHGKSQAVASNVKSLLKDIDTVHGIDTSTNVFGNTDYVPTVAMSKRFRVLVNPDDYAACVVADALASALHCVVLTADTNSLPSSTKVNLASAPDASVIVVGSKASISDSVKTAAADATGGVSARVAGDTAEELAVNAVNFVHDYEDEKYPAIPSADIDGFGTTAFVMPQTESAAAFAAIAWANAKRAPIFFMKNDGTLNDASVKAMADCGITDAVIIGATKEQGDAFVAQNTEVVATAWEGASSVETTAKAYEARAVEDGTLTEAVSVFCAERDYGVLAAAAATCGASGSALVFVDSEFNMRDYYSTLVYGFLVASFDQVSAAVMNSQLGIWDKKDDSNLRFGSASASDVAATGKAVSPKLVVKSKDGTVLTANTDYTVVYYSNATNKVVSASELVNPGRYTVVVTGTRKAVGSTFTTADSTVTEYTGSKYYYSCAATFSITGSLPSATTTTPKVTKVSKPGKITSVTVKSKSKKTVKVSWKKKTGATKYQIQWRVKGKSAWKSKTVKSASVTLKKLTSKKKYQIRVRAVNSAGSGSWSKVKTIKVK